MLDKAQVGWRYLDDTGGVGGADPVVRGVALAAVHIGPPLLPGDHTPELSRSKDSGDLQELFEVEQRKVVWMWTCLIAIAMGNSRNQATEPILQLFPSRPDT